MAMPGYGPSGTAMQPSRQPIVPNAVLGMLLFVIAEAMLFAGLIAAFTIVKAGTLGSWPPLGQPRLPIEATAFNSGVLLLSGVVLFWARSAFREAPKRAQNPLLIAVLLGVFFVAFQGWEWIALIKQGLTITTSTHGSFFYLIVGVHALHAVGALCVMAIAWARLYRGQPDADLFAAAQVFWYFVIGVWPVIYLQVYLG
jgi:cytochrome c oxidase subunit 3